VWRRIVDAAVGGIAIKIAILMFAARADISKNMPGTLNVSISLSISTTIYAAELGGNAFGGPLKYWPVRIESADFSSASLSYLISSNEFPCSYSGISRPDVLRHSVVTKLDGNGNLFEGIAWDGGICGDWQDGQFLES
jgi:hypothetical protein